MKYYHILFICLLWFSFNVDLDIHAHWWKTPLMTLNSALNKGDFEKAKKAIDRGADTTAVRSIYNIKNHYQEAVISFLLAYPVSEQFKTEAINVAIQNHNIELVKKLAGLGWNVNNILNCNDSQICHFLLDFDVGQQFKAYTFLAAVDRNDFELLEKVLGKGLCLHSYYSFGTPLLSIALEKAIERSQLNMTEWLLERGSAYDMGTFINRTEDYWYNNETDCIDDATILMIATHYGHIEIVKTILAYHKDTSEKTQSSIRRASEIAKEKGNNQIYALLTEYLNRIGQETRTTIPTHSLAFAGNAIAH